MYDAMVVAFREQPGNAAHAARAAGCERRLAKRAYEKGWPACLKPSLHPWCRPIVEVLEEERVAKRLADKMTREDEEAKIALAEAEAKAAEMRLQRLIKDTKGERFDMEGTAVRAARDNAAGLVALVGHLGQATIPLVRELRKEYEARAKEKGAKQDPGQTIETLRKIAWITAQSNAALKVAIEMERFHLGTNDKIPGLDGQVDEDSALAAFNGDEEELIQAARELLEGKKTVRALRLVESQTRTAEG